ILFATQNVARHSGQVQHLRLLRPHLRLRRGDLSHRAAHLWPGPLFGVCPNRRHVRAILITTGKFIIGLCSFDFKFFIPTILLSLSWTLAVTLSLFFFYSKHLVLRFHSSPLVYPPFVLAPSATCCPKPKASNCQT